MKKTYRIYAEVDQGRSSEDVTHELGIVEITSEQEFEDLKAFDGVEYEDTDCDTCEIHIEELDTVPLEDLLKELKELVNEE